MPQTPCLFIFDMNSLFARTYSALTKKREPNTPNDYFEGEPIFALLPTLRLMLKEVRACERLIARRFTHIVLVFDHQGKNFRHGLSDKYKRNRPEKTSSWKKQEALLSDFFNQLGFATLQISGVESDDVIASIAYKLKNVDIFKVIFTGDKDLMSLCNENTLIYAGRENKLYDPNAVESKFQIPVHCLLDYLSLVGDQVDGVSGIPGVGPDSAIKILQQMSFDQMLENPSYLMTLPIRGAKNIAHWLSENPEDAKLQQQLIQLKTDVMLHTNLSIMKISPAQIKNNLLGRYIQNRHLEQITRKI